MFAQLIHTACKLRFSSARWTGDGEDSRIGQRAFFKIDDVRSSKMICYPFRLLMCCLVTDGGGALIMTSAERAKDFPTKPVYVRGTGESAETPLISQMEDFTSSRAFRVSGKQAFAEAGITHADVDHLMIYDAFAHLPIYGLEDLGFCEKGEGGRFVRVLTRDQRFVVESHCDFSRNSRNHADELIRRLSIAGCKT